MNYRDIFLKDKIKGIFPHQFTVGKAYNIARVAIQHFKAKSVLICHDQRTSSADLAKAAFAGCGDIDVKFGGMQPKPIFELLARTHERDLALWFGDDSFEPTLVSLEIYRSGEYELNLEALLVAAEMFTDRDYTQQPVVHNEVFSTSVCIADFVKEKIDTKRINAIIAIDAANSTAGRLSEAFCNLSAGLEILTIHAEPCATMPHTKADTKNPLNLLPVFEFIRTQNCDLGFLFDQHCLDFLVIDQKGNYARMNDFTVQQVDEALKTAPIVALKVMSEYENDLSSVQSAKRIQDIKLEDKTAEMQFLLENLWYTWNPHYILPIIDLYGDGWRRNIPPKAMIAQTGEKQLITLSSQKSWQIDQMLRLFGQYLLAETWFDSEVGRDQPANILRESPLAYFCMEYGLVDWLQIYSGGLGVLAADTIKEFSDLGIPAVAIGLFYHKGFFHQDFTSEGEQAETYLDYFPTEMPFTRVKNSAGEDLKIKLKIAGEDVVVIAWKVMVGKTPLYLLDSNVEVNSDSAKQITANLYGGDQTNRIRQEIILGIGGKRLLDELAIKPAIWHMNEGHSAFLILELCRAFMKDGLDFLTSLGKARECTVFTNHTLKQAGNDIFDLKLIQDNMGELIGDAGISLEQFFELGADNEYALGNFSMTKFAMRNARKSNAVSIIHGVAAQRLWPEHSLIPITNGVHMPTWVSPEIHELLDAYLGEDWHNPRFEPDYSAIHKIDDDLIWNAHLVRKKKLIETLSRELGLKLDPDALTIAWSRRLAAYKRPDMILSECDRLADLVNQSGKPMQILIAGKAHPKDQQGKELLKEMNKRVMRAEFKNKVLIIPGYNWQLARRMTSGADIWLNTPYRFEEASGTSGMKAAANGVLQLTTKDGWTDEVDWYDIGWVIDEEHPVKSLHDILEYQILPMYFDALPGKPNQHWARMMKNSMRLVLEKYSTTRMVKDYLIKIYFPR